MTTIPLSIDAVDMPCPGLAGVFCHANQLMTLVLLPEGDVAAVPVVGWEDELDRRGFDHVDRCEGDCVFAAGSEVVAP